MSSLDWLVLSSTLIFIVSYGVWRTRGSKDISGYLKGDNTMKWGTVGLSVMATQASAITFLSTPGQAYESGMDFVQNYFGLPLALIIVAAVFIPIFYRLKVYTAYEYLENRFDHRTRILGALLFLVQRGLAAGITIYAPAIVLSTMLGWNLTFTILVVGILVIIYTVSGGTRAVSLTQKYQMGVIMLGMVIAFILILQKMPEGVGLGSMVSLAGNMGKMEVVDFSLDFSKRYTFWSGITGGLFLALSYFGTDQSQVSRYIGASSITESRMGLMFNAIFKIPMQFFILLTGVMVFMFYQFEKPPVFFKQVAMEQGLSGPYAEEMRAANEAHDQNFILKKEALEQLLQARASEDPVAMAEARDLVDQRLAEHKAIRTEVKDLLVKTDDRIEVKDSDYVFLTFVLNYLPAGFIGLLLAVILSAAMSSTSSELNALASTSMVDFYKRWFYPDASPKHYLTVSKLLTAGWGVLAITFALLAYMAENLIEMVNIVGSLFYGTILGIFIVGFFIKYIRGIAVFWAALLAEALVITLHFLTVYEIFVLSYLWYNVIGCALVIVFGFIFQFLKTEKQLS